MRVCRVVALWNETFSKRDTEKLDIRHFAKLTNALGVLIHRCEQLKNASNPTTHVSGEIDFETALQWPVDSLNLVLCVKRMLWSIEQLLVLNNYLLREEGDTGKNLQWIKGCALQMKLMAEPLVHFNFTNEVTHGTFHNLDSSYGKVHTGTEWAFSYP